MNAFVGIEKEDYEYYNNLILILLAKKKEEREGYEQDIKNWEEYEKEMSVFNVVTFKYRDNPLYHLYCSALEWLKNYNDDYYSNLEKLFTHDCKATYIPIDLYYELREIDNERSS